jgi:hypothetical protein
VQGLAQPAPSLLNPALGRVCQEAEHRHAELDVHMHQDLLADYELHSYSLYKSCCVKELDEHMLLLTE